MSFRPRGRQPYPGSPTPLLHAIPTPKTPQQKLTDYLRAKYQSCYLTGPRSPSLILQAHGITIPVHAWVLALHTHHFNLYLYKNTPIFPLLAAPTLVSIPPTHPSTAVTSAVQFAYLGNYDEPKSENKLQFVFSHYEVWRVGMAWRMKELAEHARTRLEGAILYCDNYGFWEYGGWEELKRKMEGYCGGNVDEMMHVSLMWGKIIVSRKSSLIGCARKGKGRK